LECEDQGHKNGNSDADDTWNEISTSQIIRDQLQATSLRLGCDGLSKPEKGGIAHTRALELGLKGLH